MHGVFGNPAVVAKEIGGQFRPGTDRIVQNLFGPIAKIVWPHDTEAFVATIAKVDVRTARRWLAGESDADPLVYAEMWVAIIRARRP
jgi:hypothetical protein